MRRSRLGFGTATFALAGTVGVLLLLPGDPSGEAAAPAPVVQTAFAPSSELKTFLDNAVDPGQGQQTSDQVIAAVASAPEAGRKADEVQVATAAPTAPIQGLALPQTADMTVTGSVAAPAGTLTARTAVNMRSGPSTSYETMTVLQPDEPVSVLERDGGWAKIQRSDGATGWVYGSYLGDGTAVASTSAPVRSAEPRPEREVRQASVEPREVEAEPVRKKPRFSLRKEKTVEARRPNGQLAAVRLRASPSSGAATVMTVEPGTPLRIAEKRRGWARVVIPGGASGWVRVN